MKIDMDLWLNYRMGLIEGNLTLEQQQEIDTCEFSSRLLVPTESLKKLYCELKDEGFSEMEIFDKLLNSFGVPSDVMRIRLLDLQELLDEEYSTNEVSVEKSQLVKSIFRKK